MSSSAALSESAMVDREAYISGMRKHCAAVTLITSAYNGIRAGMTATAACSVSADPPTLLICVNRNSGVFDTICRSGTFALNVLRDTQSDLAQDFSVRLSGEQRFSSGQWQTGENGAPVLAGSAVSFECKTIEQLDMHTHMVIFGQIEAVHEEPGSQATTLLYGSGSYGCFNSL